VLRIFGQCSLGKAHIGQEILLGVFEQARHLWRNSPQLGDDPGGNLAGHVPINGGKYLLERAAHQRMALARHVPQHVAHEMHATALPLGPDHRFDRSFQSPVRIRDHELDPRGPAGNEPSDELSPGGLGFDLAHVDADHLASAGLVDAIGDKERLVAHGVGIGVAHSLDPRKEPDVRVCATQGVGHETQLRARRVRRRRGSRWISRCHRSRAGWPGARLCGWRRR